MAGKYSGERQSGGMVAWGPPDCSTAATALRAGRKLLR